MACIPSSLINLLMRSHHTDKNSTNSTTDDDFLPLALPLLQPVKDITSDLLSQCPHICLSIVQLRYLLKAKCTHSSAPLTSTCAHTHLCKPRIQPGTVRGGEEKPFHWCVVLFEIPSSVYCNQSASDYSTPSKDPAAIHHPN